jgi:exosortase/archaeosortase family protein
MRSLIIQLGVSKIFIRKNHSWLLFFLITLILAGTTWYLLYLGWVINHIINPYAFYIARVCGKILQLLVANIQVEDTIVGQPGGFAMLISAKCTGLFQAAFLIAGIIATPARFFQRIIGIAAGTIILSAINLFRLITIFLVGIYTPKFLEIYHDIIWETLMIIITFFVWYQWKKIIVKNSS